MKQRLSNFWHNNKYLLLSLGLFIVWQLLDASDVWADGSSTNSASGTTTTSGVTGSVLVSVRNRAVFIIEHVKVIAYVLGGFGLVGVAWGAIFGKINWKWFGNLAIGLFIISWMGMTIDYFTGRTKSAENAFKTTGIEKSYFADTLLASGETGTGTTNATSDNEMSEEEKAAQAAAQAEVARQKWCSDNFSQCLSCVSLAITDVCKQCQSNKCNEATNGNTNNGTPGGTTATSGNTGDANTPSGTTATSGNTNTSGGSGCNCSELQKGTSAWSSCGCGSNDNSSSGGNDCDCSSLTPGTLAYADCNCGGSDTSDRTSCFEHCNEIEMSECNPCLNRCINSNPGGCDRNVCSACREADKCYDDCSNL